MTVVTRLALAIGAVLLIVTAVLAFLPLSSSSTGLSCGSAVISKVGGDDVDQARDLGKELKDGAYDLLSTTGDGSEDQAVAAVVGTIECADQLHDRRVLIIGALAVAIVLPGLVLFVGAGQRRKA